jgi:cell division protein FtsL
MSALRRPGILIGALLILLVGAAFLTQVVPYRQIIDSKQNVESAREELANLKAENSQLELDIEALNTDSEVEKLAREKLGYVRPGEKAFVVVDPPQSEDEETGTTVPSEPEPEETWVDRFWSFVTGADQAG